MIRYFSETYFVLNKKRLKTRLCVLYERQDFRTLRLLNFIINNNTEDTFQEVTKLILTLLITPITTAEAKCCFSALKRVKTFSRSTMCQECLNALAML
ncbi:hypothetical protein PR048_011875 [Dryococelus australis]|uniref:HAT C-terminal dimerisation domain-containing protein n=1 Tax=Dryococelus australis TaxID=614101 RepID=A0ABQ9HMW8_9NEOP|nr:hypothetical protein PR048_011875 [Dryococelus australis]